METLCYLHTFPVNLNLFQSEKNIKNIYDLKKKQNMIFAFNQLIVRNGDIGKKYFWVAQRNQFHLGYYGGHNIIVQPIRYLKT